MITFFFIKDTILTLIERDSIIGIRLGNKFLFGIALELQHIKKDKLRKALYKIFPILYLSFFRYTGQSGRIEIFCVKLLGAKFSFVTKGRRKKYQFSFLWWVYNRYGI